MPADAVPTTRRPPIVAVGSGLLATGGGATGGGATGGGVVSMSAAVVLLTSLVCLTLPKADGYFRRERAT